MSNAIADVLLDDEIAELDEREAAARELTRMLNRDYSSCIDPIGMLAAVRKARVAFQAETALQQARMLLNLAAEKAPWLASVGDAVKIRKQIDDAITALAGYCEIDGKVSK